MNMNREELDNTVDQMVEMLGVEEVLNELTQAMSVDELQENLEHISHMQELHLFYVIERKAKSREELDEIIDQMVEMLGAEETLDELTKAMSTDELQENLEYISHMWELNLF